MNKVNLNNKVNWDTIEPRNVLEILENGKSYIERIKCFAIIDLKD